MADANSTKLTDLWKNEVHKTCTGCKVSKPLSAFAYGGPHSGRYGHHSKCKACAKELARIYREQYPDKAYAAWTRATLKRYGLTLDDYQSILASQNGVCAICKCACHNHKRLSVDHCHKTRQVRGLLCDHCNKGLGHFFDSASLLRAAADYLERHAASRTP